jgi:hypothetical protein
MYWCYWNTYHISADPNKLSEAISNYIFNADVDADTRLIYKENSWLYVLFSDKRYGDGFKGLARLKCGWNGKYTIYGADYGSGFPVSTYFFAGGDGVFAIYGLFPDERAVRYEYANTGLGTIKKLAVYSGSVSNKAFIQICKAGEPDWQGLHIYNSSGDDITGSYSNSEISGAPRGTTATAELFMTDIRCGVIIFIGLLFALLSWRQKGK